MDISFIRQYCITKVLLSVKIFSIFAIFTLLVMSVSSCSYQKLEEKDKKQYFEEGMSLFKKSDFIEASKKFDEILNNDPQEFDALYMGGVCYFNLADYKAALKYFRKAAAERPLDTTVKIKIIESLLKTGRYARIIKYELEPMLVADPKNKDLRLVKIECLIGMNNFLDADIEIDNLLKVGFNDSKLYYLKSLSNFKNGKFEEAKNIIMKYYKNSEDWLSLAQLFIKNYMDNRNYLYIEEIYEMIINNSNDKLPHQLEFAKYYEQVGEKAKAEALYEEMLKVYPENTQIKLKYINCLVQHEMFEKAERELLPVLNKFPYNLDFNKVLISLYSKTSRMNEAIHLTQDTLNNMVKDSNEYVDVQNILANLYIINKNYEQSLQIIDEILKKEAHNSDARFNQCKIFLHQGNSLAAIGQLRLLINKNPTMSQYYYYLGMAHEMRGELTMAEEAFRKAIDLSPDDKDALKKWINIYSKKGYADEIQKRIKNYIEIVPNDREILELLKQYRKDNPDVSSMN